MFWWECKIALLQSQTTDAIEISSLNLALFIARLQIGLQFKLRDIIYNWIRWIFLRYICRPTSREHTKKKPA